ncbi:MAG: YigZ family protein [Thermotogaceae bacterium]|nr:YigZ family protein [Thermotogaceae bacterium]
MEMKVPKGTHRNKINIKRSIFIATVSRAYSVEEAKEFIKKVSREFSDATHNCWAYRVYEDATILEHSSDAGEPSGTAGISILNAIKSLNFYNTAVVVTRYFGGVKLGVKGLREAYSKSAKSALEAVEYTIVKPMNIYRVQSHISDYGKVKSILSKETTIVEEEFFEDKFEIVYASDKPLTEDSILIRKEFVSVD